MTGLVNGSCALTVAMATPPDGASNVWVQLVPFALILGIFYFVILLPMKRRQKKVADFQAGLKVGDRIVTTGGIYGSIVKMDEGTVTLQIDERSRLKVARAAIAGYQGQEPVVPESSNA